MRPAVCLLRVDIPPVGKEEIAELHLHIGRRRALSTQPPNQVHRQKRADDERESSHDLPDWRLGLPTDDCDRRLTTTDDSD